MSDLAIRVNGLGKQYKIGRKQARYRTLRDTLSEVALSPFQRIKGILRGEPYSASGLRETIWALKDVSFEIKHGEVVGIIGRNGAGKSTLLKILSEITEPTEGTVDLYGRVGSLLEVGTGFHPELTGRENVYLNGAILGMTRYEIDRKFDEIVDFAGVEKFIDTPVKHFSSGMQLRLGFAVAAHLEPEILVVDEVLAVGDAEFQKKCMGKMDHVASQGRTVLFVSHNISMINALCDFGIVIEKGEIAFDGLIDEAVRTYLKFLSSNNNNAIFENPNRKGNQLVKFIAARAINAKGERTSQFESGKPISLEFDYRNFSNIRHADCNFTIYNLLGNPLFVLDFELTNFQTEIGECGTFSCEIPKLPLPIGRYRVAGALKIGGVIQEHLQNMLEIDVQSSIFFPGGKVPKANIPMVDHVWTHKKME